MTVNRMWVGIIQNIFFRVDIYRHSCAQCRKRIGSSVIAVHAPRYVFSQGSPRSNSYLFFKWRSYPLSMSRVVFVAFEGPLVVTSVMVIKNISLPFSAYGTMYI